MERKWLSRPNMAQLISGTIHIGLYGETCVDLIIIMYSENNYEQINMELSLITCIMISYGLTLFMYQSTVYLLEILVILFTKGMLSI